MYPIQAVREFNNMTTVAFTFKLKAIEKIKIKFNINININISVKKKHIATHPEKINVGKTK